MLLQISVTVLALKMLCTVDGHSTIYVCTHHSSNEIPVDCVSMVTLKIVLARLSLAGQTLTQGERVWSNSHQVFVLHTQQQGI